MKLLTGGFGKLGNTLPDMGDIVWTSESDFDITDYKKVKEYMEMFKPETIIHLASLVRGECDKNRKLAMKVNVEATRNLLLLGQDNGLKRFIFSSSSAVYNQTELEPTGENENVSPTTYYGETKLLAEKEIEKNCNCTAFNFRIFNIYGKGFADSLINRLISGEKVNCANPEVYYRDYVYSKDVAKFIVNAIDIKVPEGVHTLNLGTGMVRSTREVLDYLQSIGIKPNYKAVKSKKINISWADPTNLFNTFGYIPNSEIILK